MTDMMPHGLRALPIALSLAAAACCWTTAASAQSTAGPTETTVRPAPVAAEALPASPAVTGAGTIRLSDAERDAILDSSTEASAAAARREDLTGSGNPDRRIHGEMGVMIGSNGTRGAYGTAAIPLGDNAGAVISFESSRFGYPRSRRAPR